MFGAARWRLTLWFTLALGVILVVIGVAVYLTTRAALYDQVNSDLQSRAGQEQRQLTPRLMGPNGPTRLAEIVIGPVSTAGGYFYALVAPTGEFLAGTPNVDPAGLATVDTVEEALANGTAFAHTQSSEGDSLRVYVVRLDDPTGQNLLMEVGRSTEPEEHALRRLLLVLSGGFGGGLILALVSGYLLSGRALRPIRAAMDSQRAFIADASHDLRTPLSLVRASAELLKRHASESVSANREAVDDIIAESDRLSTMVSQMLTLAQADAGKAKLSLSEIALDELANDVTRSMRPLAAERGVSVETHADGPVRLRGDSDRLRQLMMILTDNAIKYSEAGDKVRLEVQSSSSHKAIVRVSDTGCGIPAEALPHIFDRFYRVDKARSQEAGGTGLGLSIARWIAEAHGGTIHAESTPGVATTVTVELPA